MIHTRKKRIKTQKTELIKLEHENKDSRSICIVLLQKGCYLLMMWTGFGIFICCFVSWYSCGNLHSKSVEEQDILVNKISELSKETNEVEVKNDKSIVELVPTSLPDEEEDEESYMFTPTVAPATPKMFLHTSSILESPSSSLILSVSKPAVSISATPSIPVTLNTVETKKENVESDEPEKEILPDSQGIVKGEKRITNDEEIKDATEKNPSSDEQKELTQDLEEKNANNENIFNSKNEIVDEKPDIMLQSTSAPIITPSQVTEPVSVLNDQTTTSSPKNILPKQEDGSEKTEEKSFENVQGEKEDGKMLSFTEWKLKHDREKENKEKEEDVEEETVDSSEGTVNITLSGNKKKKKKKKKKLSKNYALPSCGAKVISTNKEAQNINAILKEDKDVYMLNPCNVRAWVVIELCERIQLHSIDFANFEMFSSTPELFTIHVSNRFPTRDWELVEHFQARPGREVQTFPIKEKFYAKYIKFEVLKNIGKEHYCPLSLLRVFGMTEVEEFENENDESHTEDEADVSGSQAKDDNVDDGIFESAKQAVVGLVNNVAKTFTGQKENEDKSNGTAPANVSKIVTLMTHNDHFFEFFDESNFITTCIQRTLYSKYNTSLNPSCQFGLTYMFIKRMCPSLSLYHVNFLQENQVGHPPIPSPPLKKTNKHVENVNENFDEVIETNLLTTAAKPDLVEEKAGTIQKTSKVDTTQETLNVVATARDVATTQPSVSTADSTCSTQQKPSIDITKLVENLPKPSFARELSSSQIMTKALDVVTTPEAVIPLHVSNVMPTIHIMSADTKSSDVKSIETKSIEAKSLEIESIQSNSEETKPKAKADSVDILEFKANHTDTTSMVAEKVIQSDINVVEKENLSGIEKKGKQEEFRGVTDIFIENISVSDLKKVEGKIENVQSISTSGTSEGTREDSLKVDLNAAAERVISNEESKIEISTETKETLEETDNSGIIVETQIPSTVPPTSAPTATTPTSTTPTSTTPTSTTPTAPPSTIPTTPTQAPDNEKSSKTKSVQPVGGLSGSKESIVVKLSAKIKALQENLTMSMMYLEEMSERYRTAVEEVDERHKKKAVAMTVSLKSQQDIIQHQSKMINNLTKTISSLTSQIQNLTNTFQQQHEIMTEKHVFWIFMEIILIVFFSTFCIRRPPPQTQYEAKKNETNRRKSEPSNIHSPKNDFVNLKKKRSHSNVEQPTKFLQKTDDVHTSLEEIEFEVSRRKKRKKHIPLSLKAETIKETRLSKTAGLLFYAGKGILSGITGAFNYGTEIVKPSRRADALIDTIHKPCMSKKEKILRRTRSIELPTVIEEVSSNTDIHLTPLLHDIPKESPERPKSAEAVFYNGSRKQKGKMNCKSLARFV